MAVDKLVDSTQLNSDLTSVANAIRTRGGTSSQLAFPSGFVSAVGAIGNTYTAGDEGKVVDNGALVAQTAHADVTPTTSDQTIDTTTNNSLKVKGDANLVAGNIKKDVTIFGTTGSYEGGGGVSWSDIADGSQPSGLITITATNIRANQLSFSPEQNWQLYAPNCTTNNNGNAIRGAKKCTHAAFPALTTITTGYFAYQATNLEVLDLGSVNEIRNSAFDQCTNLGTLILRKSNGLVSLINVNNFNGSKFASGKAGGTIYIPKVFYDHLGDGTSSDYKAASNWSTLNGYGTVTWAKIEGSSYEDMDWITKL